MTVHSNLFSWADAATIKIEGHKVAEFLQGYLTSDCLGISASKLSPTALCNLRGRVVANGWIFLSHIDDVHLLVHRTLADRVVEFLTPYARFAKCTLQTLPQKVVVSRSQGIGNLPGSWRVVADSQEPAREDQSSGLNQAFIDEKFAWISASTTEKFLPQMLALTDNGAVDFNKGCYLGQEVVARAQYRGAVKRQLHHFSWFDNAPIIGAKSDHLGTVIAIANSTVSADNGAGLAVK